VAVWGADCFLNERDWSSIEGDMVGLDSWQCGSLAVSVAVAVAGSGCVAVGGADCFLNERDRSSIDGVVVF
jgi:hypothetical protein